MKIKRIITTTIMGALLLGAAACSNNSQSATDAMKRRQDKFDNLVLCGETNDSLECKNLALKKKRDEDPNRITFVYIFLPMSKEPLGYFVAKGKVSSNQSQMGPMDMIVDACIETSDYCPEVMEAPGDDGSSGPNEDGVFFFTPKGDKVVWNGIYLQLDAPLDLTGVSELQQVPNTK